MQILGTGLSGLVGSRIVDQLSDCVFSNLDLTTGVDITNEQQVMDAVQKSPAEVILHLAAFTDPNAAWDQKGDKNGVCYKVNVTGTENLVKTAQSFGKHFIHVSTAFVFDGTKEDIYVETDDVHPIEWYGETKALAEEVVQQKCDHWTIFRIDQPFRSDKFEKKSDTTHRIITGIQTKKLYPQFVDHWFSPTIIEDFALAVNWAAENKSQGIFHATSNVKVSDFEYATMVNDALHLDGEIQQGFLENYLKTLNRPYQRNTAMNSSKLQETANLIPTQLSEALERIIL